MDAKKKTFSIFGLRLCVVPYAILFSAYFANGATLQFLPFAGAMGAINTLSADAASQPAPGGLSASLYKPENGPALQIFGGAHLSDYFSLQANYVWRRNDLSISSSAPAAGNFYMESRNSSQQGFILDALVYFRPLTSRIRPYLAVGTGFVRFESSQTAVLERGSSSTLPPMQFSSIKPVFDSPVGIDLAITRRLAFRYSFAETLRHNDISHRLSPPGKRILADYQNLFGVVFRL